MYVRGGSDDAWSGRRSGCFDGLRARHELLDRALSLRLLLAPLSLLVLGAFHLFAHLELNRGTVRVHVHYTSKVHNCNNNLHLKANFSSNVRVRKCSHRCQLL